MKPFTFVLLLCLCCCKPGKITSEASYQTDINGKVYAKKIIKKHGMTLYHVDANGKQTAVCASPHKEARIFGGNTQKLDEFIAQNLVHPVTHAEGKVYLVLLISKTGDIKDIRVIKGILGCEACNTNAVELAGKLANWEPAYYRNKKQASLKYMHIPF